MEEDGKVRWQGKMARNIQRRRYLFVLVATVIIFSLGLLMGMVVNEKKVDFMERLTATQNLDALSLQLQFTYLNSLDINSTEGCKAMNAALEHSWTTLAIAYSNLVKYKDSPDVNSDNVKLLERNDLLNNIRYWFLLKKAKTFCELEDSVSVLFFFSEKGCYECGAQSAILEHYKEIFDERFLLFHINRDIEDPMVHLLVNQYEASVSPTIILEDEKFEGVMAKEELKKVVCSKFRTEQPECKS